MPTSRNHRTAPVAALLDLLDFVDEKLREALDDPEVTVGGCNGAAMRHAADAGASA